MSGGLRTATQRLVASLSVALSLGLGVLSAGPAVAAGESPSPVAAAVSDVTQAGGLITGVVTLHAAQALRIDPGSVRAELDGTNYPVTVESIARAQRRTMLVVDTSGSMGEAGMATLRSAVGAFLRGVPTDVLVGVVSFAGSSRLQLSPTLDRSAVQRVVDGLSSSGGTSLYAGVRDALSALASTRGAGERSMILLSDGADTSRGSVTGERDRVIAAVAAAGVRVEVVRFATDDPGAAAALAGLADAGGGSVVATGDATGVLTAFDGAARALDSQLRFAFRPAVIAAGKHLISVTGLASGHPFTARQASALLAVAGGAVDSGAAPALVSPVRGAAAALLPASIDAPIGGTALLLGAGALCLAVLVLVSAVALPRVRSPREARVASIEDYVSGFSDRSGSSSGSAAWGAAGVAPPSVTAISEQLVGIGEKVMTSHTFGATTTALIRRADLPLRAGEWFVLRIVAVVAGVAAGMVLLTVSRPAGGLLGGVLAAVVPAVVLRFLAARRSKAFERILPELLTLVASSLSSGFSLPQALDATARNAGWPADRELSRALAETRIGTDVSDALDHVADRMGSDTLRWTTMAIRVQREVGGNLADTLRTTAQTLSERESLHRQVRTLSAEGRLSAYILIAMPICLLGYSTMVNYDYISLLWTTLPGILMMIGGATLMVIGSVWMSRVVKIEV